MEEKILKKLGKIISKIRKEKNLSQEKLAFASGMSSNHIGEIERGNVNSSIVTVYKISKALNIKLSKLLEDLTF
ncbi:MAG: helix-turn-helix transcriptional regulator [bacterium]